MCELFKIQHQRAAIQNVVEAFLSANKRNRLHNYHNDDHHDDYQTHHQHDNSQAHHHNLYRTHSLNEAMKCVSYSKSSTREPYKMSSKRSYRRRAALDDDDDDDDDDTHAQGGSGGEKRSRTELLREARMLQKARGPGKVLH